MAAAQRQGGALFVAVTLLGVGLVGLVVYEKQKRELEQTLGELLLNVARTGALLIDAEQHAEVQRTLRQDSEAYLRVRAVLAAVQHENRIATPVYTLTDYDVRPGTSGGPPRLSAPPGYPGRALPACC